MQILNATKMQAGYTMGMQPDGRELLVVVVKGTFLIPRAGQPAELAPEQEKLVDADVFTGDPGFSAPLYESDYAPRKPKCDVLLNGSAYAPNAYPADRVRVGLRVASMTKVFDVVGNRVWREVMATISATRPEPFTVMPISYDNAFGGVDNSHPDPAHHRTFLANHVGKGFVHNLETHVYAGKPLPNTEDPNEPVAAPNRRYRPMAFGAIGRSWEPRFRFAGTYDQKWMDNVFPFLPADFDERYYQAAPADQQIDHLRGREQVTLYNLTPHGRVDFMVPSVDVPVTFFLKNGEESEQAAVNDTLIIEPDQRRFMMVWRVARPLKRDMFEVEEILAGRMPGGWHRARAVGKTYYPSLSDFVAVRKAELEEMEVEETEGEETEEEEVEEEVEEEEEEVLEGDIDEDLPAGEPA
jgi:hypothetical protein